MELHPRWKLCIPYLRHRFDFRGGGCLAAGGLLLAYVQLTWTGGMERINDIITTIRIAVLHDAMKYNMSIN